MIRPLAALALVAVSACATGQPFAKAHVGVSPNGVSVNPVVGIAGSNVSLVLSP